MTAPIVSQSELPQDRRQRIYALTRRLLPFGSGVIATLIALILYTILFPAPRQMTQKDVNASVAQALASATAPPAYSALVYQVIRPSLVLIQSQLLETEGLAAADGLGTGVIINDAGNILTSLHVVANEPNLLVIFADGT